MKTKRPKDGSPWIVPANEARGAFISDSNGPKLISEIVSPFKLRRNQLPPHVFERYYGARK